ncbi:hypothetical protein LOD99_15646 [Oopsacas minuta]|uniref:Ubiquitin-like domain-containing protein n=1 Tax=Oopsacas minuta TaxID=111878 RepID=A0AAV7K9K7_9METZ|nr:hypothetical protein LOD99_15646 [Oopsacas minuta]
MNRQMTGYFGTLLKVAAGVVIGAVGVTVETAAVIIVLVSVPILIGATAVGVGLAAGGAAGRGAERGTVAINKHRTESNFDGKSNTIQIFILNSDGSDTYLTMPSSKDRIRQLKVRIQQKLGVNTQNQCLRYQGIQLEDTNTLESYNITNNNSTIRLSIGTQGGSIGQDFIDSIYLDPHWDRDYTNLTREHIKRMRGGYQYYRPCGWKRIAIKVTGKYSDDKWLGHTGAKGEWAVTYHGTKQPVFEKICGEGYKVGPRAAYGKGVYSSPDINVVQCYASQFQINGVEYLGIFQNRVNPSGVNIVCAGKFWVCPDPKDIRPYGLCVKRC